MTKKESREVQLLKAAANLPIGLDFFDAFPENEEMLALGLTLAIRRLLNIIANTETAPKDVIPAARLIFQLNGKDVGDGADDTGLSKADREAVSAELDRALSRTKTT